MIRDDETKSDRGPSIHHGVPAAEANSGPRTGHGGAEPTGGRAGVAAVAPEGSIAPTGTWSAGARAGDYLFVAGMRGIDPVTNTLVDGARSRIRQGFWNMQWIASSQGASLRDAVRVVVYVTDMAGLRPLVNEVQAELWGGPPYPPRTIVEVERLSEDDIFEVEGTFYVPR